MKNNDAVTPTFLFHDYETFGKHPALDRPAQFAGIRTDAEFNIIGEPEVFYCQPADDYLPQPEAVMITGITPQHALAQGSVKPNLHDVFILCSLNLRPVWWVTITFASMMKSAAIFFTVTFMILMAGAGRLVTPGGICWT